MPKGAETQLSVLSAANCLLASSIEAEVPLRGEIRQTAETMFAFLEIQI